MNAHVEITDAGGPGAVRAAAVTLDGVSKRFDASRERSLTAIADVSFEVPDNEFLVVTGPSGCGKSTLLYVIGGFVPPTGGSVLIRGREIGGPGPDRGIVFQDSALFPWMTVKRNAEFGLRAQGASDRGRAGHYLERMGLSEFSNAYPSTLSGGMKQRVAIARALAPDPPIVLMDEPFAALDSQTRFELGGEIERLRIEERRTFIFVTHGIREAVRLADRIVVLSRRPSQVKEIVTVAIERPRNVHTTEFQELERYVEGLIERQ